MSPNINNWLGLNPTIVAADRAIDAWRRINDKPASIVIERGDDDDLAAQIVRIEHSEEVREVVGDAGVSAERNLIVFGVRSHPSVANTDIQRDDRFLYNDAVYRVIDIVLTPGEVQGRAEVQS